MNARYDRDLFEVPPPRVFDAEPLRRYLSETGACRVDLTLTHNRVSMLSVNFVHNGHVRIRMHTQFLEAPSTVQGALARYLRTRRREDWAPVAIFARGIPASAVRPVETVCRLSDRGQVHDLRLIATEVNKRFFSGKVKCWTGWGGRTARSRRQGRRRSIRYGSWSPATRMIRINPLLDDMRVPRDFVAYIVFHEMLHAVVPSEHVAGRRMDHGVNYRRMERGYPEIERMKQMGRDLLDVLLR